MKKTKKKISNMILKFLLIVLLITDIYPFIWMLLGSLKKNVEFSKSMFALPEGIHLQNYVEAFRLAEIPV